MLSIAINVCTVTLKHTLPMQHLYKFEKKILLFCKIIDDDKSNR